MPPRRKGSQEFTPSILLVTGFSFFASSRLFIVIAAIIPVCIAAYFPNGYYTLPFGNAVVAKRVFFVTLILYISDKRDCLKGTCFMTIEEMKKEDRARSYQPDELSDVWRTARNDTPSMIRSRSKSRTESAL